MYNKESYYLPSICLCIKASGDCLEPAYSTVLQYEVENENFTFSILHASTINTAQSVIILHPKIGPAKRRNSKIFEQVWKSLIFYSVIITKDQ
jgi:hypothetical protein